MKKSLATINLKQGFTLIEALLAIFIFSLALVSLITLSSRGITGTAQARDQAIAQFLAQEGIEMVRNTRDTVVITNPPGYWLTLLSSCYENTPCFIEGYYAGGYTLDNGNSFGLAILSSGNNKYEPTSATTAKFTRQIYTEPMPFSSDEIVIHSVVSWYNGSIPREVHLTTLLTNWVQVSP